MQSIPPQSGVMPCVLRGYRREEALALRARLRRRPAACSAFYHTSAYEPVEIFDRFLFFRYLRCGTTLQNVHIYS
jgi:hypothetical protein